MKKLIIDVDKSKLMNIEEVLEQYRPMAHKWFRKYMKYSIITEDDKQELDIVIFKTFQSYDEIHCFSTLLVWKVRGYASNKAKVFSRSIYATDIEILDLDYTFEDGSALHEVISDDSIDIELDYMSKELVDYISSCIKPYERNILDVYLGKISMTDLAIKMNKKPQNVSNASARLKKKTSEIINRYYRNEINIA